MKNGLRLSHGVGEARAPAARPERSGGGRPLREPLDTELPVSYRTSSSSCHLPGRPLCARTSVQPRLPHLSAVETRQSLRLSHGVGEARAPAARPERSGGGCPLREPLDPELPVSYRASSSSCHLPGRPLCARTSVRPRLPHLVRGTKTGDTLSRSGPGLGRSPLLRCAFRRRVCGRCP